MPKGKRQTQMLPRKPKKASAYATKNAPKSCWRGNFGGFPNWPHKLASTNLPGDVRNFKSAGKGMGPSGGGRKNYNARGGS